MRLPASLGILAAMVVLPCASQAVQDASASGTEFFEKKIRPVLAERCYSCHSAHVEKLKGDLRLDSRAGLLKGGSQGAAIRPGDPDASLLIKALRYTDPDLRMPPKRRLPADVVRDFEAWVKAGAADPRTDLPEPGSATPHHWAFQPLREPATGDSVDRFIEAFLRARGLPMAAPADRATLLRRATYDLTGLPPTPEEIDAFLADSSPDAFATVVDRLLARREYGERWGRHWLDLVRYSDDLPEAWRFRDWVIRAFNDDLPVDRFMAMQMAGDRLAPETPGAVGADGMIATTFLSLGTWGGIDRKKRLLDIVDDEIDTVGRTFLGLTLACARCHDHKFDPISTREYYGLAGIFLSSRVMSDAAYLSHGTHPLRIPLASAEEVRKHEAVERGIRALQERLDDAVREAYRTFSVGLLGQTADYILAASGSGRREGLHEFAVARWKRLLEAPKPGARRLLSRPVQDYDGEAGVQVWMGRAERPWWGGNTTKKEIPIETFVLPPRSIAIYPSVEGGAVAWKSPIAGRIRIGGHLTDLDPLDGVGVAWVIDHEHGGTGHELSSGSLPNGGSADIGAGPVEVEVGDEIVLSISLNKEDAHYDATGVRLAIAREEGSGEWDLERDVLGSLLSGNPHDDAGGKKEVWSFWDMAGTRRPERLPALEPLLAAWKESSGRDPRKAAHEFEQSALAQGPDGPIAHELSGSRGPFWVRERDDARYLAAERRAPIEALRRELDALKRNAPPLPCAHGVLEGGLKYSLYPGFQDVPIHVRGSYERLGPVAPRGFPRALGGESNPIGEGSGRLELARWIASAKHPLTARVFVNRLWQHHFGKGLVRTPSNFGSRGDGPTHPELLDFLARRFIESGWSTKAMHRLIMLSGAYQRSCLAPPELLRADPENRLVGRMNRRRLEAESFRDGALAVAGKLDLKAGGPAEKSSSFRRMVYLRVSRGDRSGFATLFDAANPALHVEERPVSTIAPQALFMMNATLFLDLAKALSARAEVGGDSDPDRRIDRLYRLAYGRTATNEERALGRAFVKTSEARVSSAPPQALSPWQLYAQAILLSNEFVFVD